MATGIFILLVQRLWDGSVGKYFLSWDPWRCLAWVRRKTEINPHQPIRRIYRNLRLSLIQQARQKRFWGCFNPTVNGSLCHSPKHTKKPKVVLEKSHFSFSVSLLDSLLWDDLYGLSWNSRNWKKWGKISQFLNEITLSRPKRIFFLWKIIYIELLLLSQIS